MVHNTLTTVVEAQKALEQGKLHTQDGQVKEGQLKSSQQALWLLQ